MFAVRTMANSTAISYLRYSVFTSARIPRSDTIARGLKELRALSIAYTSKSGSIYAHDPALKINSLVCVKFFPCRSARG